MPHTFTLLSIQCKLYATLAKVLHSMSTHKSVIFNLIPFNFNIICLDLDPVNM
jgi:hypothetical protein